MMVIVAFKTFKKLTHSNFFFRCTLYVISRPTAELISFFSFRVYGFFLKTYSIQCRAYAGTSTLRKGQKIVNKLFIEIGYEGNHPPISVQLSKEQENSRKRENQIAEDYRFCDRVTTSHLLKSDLSVQHILMVRVFYLLPDNIFDIKYAHFVCRCLKE